MNQSQGNKRKGKFKEEKENYEEEDSNYYKTNLDNQYYADFFKKVEESLYQEVRNFWSVDKSLSKWVNAIDEVDKWDHLFDDFDERFNV